MDQKDIDRTVEKISELFSLTPFGGAEWNDIPRALTEMFPGSFSGLINIDTLTNSMPFLEVVGIEQKDLQSYIDYYYTINPYEKFWRGHSDGQVWISDYVLPITELRHDEFYNDWMAKLGEFDSAIGVKLDASAENEVRFNLQFPTRQFEQYEKPALQILQRLRAPLCRAIAMSNQIHDQQMKVATASALLDRKDKAACVLDMSMRIKDANQGFEDLLQNGQLFKQESGRLYLAHNQASQFEALVRQIALFASTQHSKLVLRDECGDWVLSCARLPTFLNAGILGHQPLVLVTITRFGYAPENPQLGSFAQAFNLTQAEERLCQALLEGHNLTDAAQKCAITYETARSRIKDVFSKTHTTKQADLLIMLEQFRSG